MIRIDRRNPDLVVTSPPYGDSATTVAYAQFSWMTNVGWLISPGALDRDLGGRRTEITDFRIQTYGRCDYKNFH